MWVFAYGSLMSEPWEEQFRGTRRGPAVLRGYRRAFSKSSTQNWGTKERPCPTLGLEPDEEARCIGLLYEFPDPARDSVLAFLQHREGKSFSFPQLQVELDDGSKVHALVPVNDRSRASYIGELPLTQRAKMARDAAGEKGRCIDYVKAIRTDLKQIGVVDRDVEDFWRSVHDP